jgi:N-acetylglucosamine-6-phosphate deacetylase
MDGVMLIPGFIDQHIHGLKGYDVMDASTEALDAFRLFLPKEGTTAYYPTTMTASTDAIIKALENIGSYEKLNEAGAELLGVHLEGPFISEVYKGAQNKDYIQSMSKKRMNAYLVTSKNKIKHITLAPELEEAKDFINYLREKDILVSLGHSDASEDQVKEALKHGALCFTHAFNAMSKLHHRDLGMVGMMLQSKETYAELIADTIHVNKEAMKLLYRVIGEDKVILVTDAMRAKQLSNGEYDLGGQNVVVKEKQARLEDGTLAGSVLEYIDGVKNMKNHLDLTIQELIKISSMNPAKLHKIDDRKGSIKQGKDADLLVLDKKLNIIRTYTRGKLAYRKDERVKT